jgi:CRP-like cAMP-binding protein
MAPRTVRFATGAVVFAQGAQSNSVFYLQEGGVTLSVLSSAGKEAVVAMLGPGDFFGEGCLAGQPMRMGTAKAVMRTALLRIPKRDMIRMLHEHREFSDRFLAHMLTRNIRIEEDLVDQLFNSTEKRLARTLLLLARYGEAEGVRHALPRVSQELLAEMVGTTRSRINFFMNKFRKLGFIDYDGDLPLKINNSLLSVVLHD